ncbi:hypothetical protein HDU96_005381 [Phlyctochytrium bullatum]|nr:hypothetical protein HDU96_005381 [Phlyctochytrium bullatum]
MAAPAPIPPHHRPQFKFYTVDDEKGSSNNNSNHSFVNEKGQFQHPFPNGFPRLKPLEFPREADRPYGYGSIYKWRTKRLTGTRGNDPNSRARYPVVSDKNVSKNINSAMVEGLDFSKAQISVPLRQKEDLSFEDALLVDDSIPLPESASSSTGSKIWKKIFDGGSGPASSGSFHPTNIPFPPALGIADPREQKRKGKEQQGSASATLPGDDESSKSPNSNFGMQQPGGVARDDELNRGPSPSRASTESQPVELTVPEDPTSISRPSTTATLTVEDPFLLETRHSIDRLSGRASLDSGVPLQDLGSDKKAPSTVSSVSSAKAEEEGVPADAVLEEVDEGSGFTFRAVLVGTLLGCIIGASNMYLGLTVGWSFGGSLFGSIVGFAILKPLSRVLPSYFGGGYFGPKENCTVQSAASAAGGLSVGFVSAIPALYRLQLMSPKVTDDTVALIMWSLAAAYFGLFFAIPLRRYFILKQKLVFPSPTVSAETIRSLHDSTAGEMTGRSKARVLLMAFLISLALKCVTWWVPVILEWHVLYFIGNATRSPALVAADLVWKWRIELAGAFIGAGMLIGVGTAGSFFGGSVLAWGIVVVAGAYGFPANMNPAKPLSEGEFSKQVTAQYWLLWPGVTMMIASSFSELGVRWPSLWRGIKGGLIEAWLSLRTFMHRKSPRPRTVTFADERPTSPLRAADQARSEEGGRALQQGELSERVLDAARKSMAVDRATFKWSPGKGKEDEEERALLAAEDGEENAQATGSPKSKGGVTMEEERTDEKKKEADVLEEEEDPAPPHHQVPMLWWGPGLLISVVFTVVVLSVFFNVGPGEAILAILLGFILAFVGIQASGETDINPTGSIGKTSQFIFAAFRSNDPAKMLKTNLIAGNVAAACASQTVDMVGDLKTAHLLRASPRSQFLAQAIGSFVAVFLSVGLFTIFGLAYPCFLAPPQGAVAFTASPTVTALSTTTLPTALPTSPATLLAHRNRTTPHSPAALRHPIALSPRSKSSESSYTSIDHKNPSVASAVHRSCPFEAPAVASWTAVSVALTSGISRTIPATSAWTSLGVLLFTIAYTVIKHRVAPPHAKPYFPNLNAVGIALVNPQPHIGVAMFLGALGSAAWKRGAEVGWTTFCFAVASGLIAGEGIGGIVEAVYALAGLQRENLAVSAGIPGEEERAMARLWVLNG